MELCPAVIRTIFPLEGDGSVVDRHNPPIADGDAADIGAELFDGIGSRTERLDVYPPVFGPHRRIDSPFFCIEPAPEVIPEGLLQKGASASCC